VPSYVARLVEELRGQGVAFDRGLTGSEVAATEDRFGFRFPPDLRLLLQTALPVSEPFPDWRRESDAALRARLAWPLEGIWLDIEHNGFWLAEWGTKPDDLTEAKEIARRAVVAAPVLIPVCSHRFLPAEPAEAGNPVFSVVQTDVVVYGSDLGDYFRAEFRRIRLPDWPPAEPRRIRFCDLVELNDG
jgi:hypothetical protein